MVPGPKDWRTEAKGHPSFCKDMWRDMKYVGLGGIGKVIETQLLQMARRNQRSITLNPELVFIPLFPSSAQPLVLCPINLC